MSSWDWVPGCWGWTPRCFGVCQLGPQSPEPMQDLNLPVSRVSWGAGARAGVPREGVPWGVDPWVSKNS